MLSPSTAGTDAVLPHWSSLPVHSLLKRSIFNMGFFKPSPIQATSLPFGLSGRDIVGVAETVRHPHYVSPVSFAL